MDSPGIVTFIFVRHTAVKVPSGTCYGHLDVPLAESFHEEAAAVRERLDGITPTLTISSPSSRCTALAAACGWPGCRTDPRVMERSFGTWEGLRYEEIEDPHLQEYYRDWIHTAPTGGESFADLTARVRDFMDITKRQLTEDLSSPSPAALIFTHGGVISSACVITGTCTEREAWSHCPPYGGIVCLKC